MKKTIPLIAKAILEIAFISVTVFGIYKAGTYFYNYAKQITAAPEPDVRSAKEIMVTIPSGATTKDIADILKENDLILSAEIFRIQSRLKKYDGLYKQGTFSLNTNMGEEEIMEILQQSASDLTQIKITVVEGTTVNGIASYLDEQGIVTAADFLYAVENSDFDYDFLENIPQRTPRLEGYLFPDTYFIREDSTPEDIISKMLYRFEEVYTKEAADYGRNTNHSMDDIIKIASIIEGEVRKEDERAVVSGVIENRIQSGMPLQMCSTVMYALGKRKDVLLLTDLEIDSPYNTYKYQGLPVGPIGNPGQEAIHAAMNPQQNDYLYFVLKDEDTGEHFFTRSYDEFTNAKALYKQIF